MNTYERLIDKAKEAFVMSIEIYNKPSIRYRLEGFSFFICNAWELMLKAYMIKSLEMNQFIIMIIQAEQLAWIDVFKRYLVMRKHLYVKIWRR